MKIDIHKINTTLPSKLARIVRQQPGYVAKAPKWLKQSSTGGIRLYQFVCNRWMDASLEDITDPDLIDICEIYRTLPDYIQQFGKIQTLAEFMAAVVELARRLNIDTISAHTLIADHADLPWSENRKKIVFTY